MIPSSSCPPSRRLDRSGPAGNHHGLAVVTPLTGTRSNLDRVPERGVTGGKAPRSPAWAGPVSAWASSRLEFSAGGDHSAVGGRGDPWFLAGFSTHLGHSQPQHRNNACHYWVCCTIRTATCEGHVALAEPQEMPGPSALLRCCGSNPAAGK